MNEQEKLQHPVNTRDFDETKEKVLRKMHDAQFSRLKTSLNTKPKPLKVLVCYRFKTTETCLGWMEFYSFCEIPSGELTEIGLRALRYEIMKVVGATEVVFTSVTRLDA